MCHSLPGLAITKGIYIIVLTTDALLPAELTLLFWTLPEGLEMFGLAQGLSQIEYPRSSVFLQAPFMPSSSVLTRLNTPTLGSLEHSDDHQWGDTLIASACKGLLYAALWFSPP